MVRVPGTVFCRIPLFTPTIRVHPHQCKCNHPNRRMNRTGIIYFLMHSGGSNCCIKRFCAAAVVASVLLLLLHSTLLSECSAAAAADHAFSLTLRSGNLEVLIDPSTGLYDVSIDSKIWLSGSSSGGSANYVLAFNGSHFLSPSGHFQSRGSNQLGSYNQFTTNWTFSSPSGSKDIVLQTYVRAYTPRVGREVVLFGQHFPLGSQPFPPSDSPVTCNTFPIAKGTDQSGGTLLKQLPNLGVEECCQHCFNYSGCDIWVRSPSSGDCFLVSHPTHLSSHPDRDLGFVTASPMSLQTSVLLGYPSFSIAAQEQPLRYVAWGGCQCAGPRYDDWNSTSVSLKRTPATDGLPLLLYNREGRSLVISPLDNFFVAAHPINHGYVSAGVKMTVEHLPNGFRYETVLVAHQGIHKTMYEWGDILLEPAGKKRVDPYDDFVLSHLGYWTDNGAFYYHNCPDFKNPEEALIAVKASYAAQKVPVRYFQWDDWWFFTDGDVPGMTYWWPTPDQFPDGLTDWLDTKLALYVPMYSANNVYMNNTRYTWKTDPWKGQSVVPLSSAFYDDLFRNGSKAGMVHFEQDFMCTYNADTQVTNRDLYSGRSWLMALDKAAQTANITVQFCMMNPVHAMESTRVLTMTNGRATGDNTRGDTDNPNGNISPLGINGLFYGSLGFLPSRDNVWTGNYQPGASKSKSPYQPNAELDNGAAVLSNGPYGPADKVNMNNVTLAMRACRSDGVLLRPRNGLKTTEIALKRAQGDEVQHVWSASDQHLIYSWFYFIGISLKEKFPLLVSDLGGAATHEYLVFDSLCPLAGWENNSCHIDVLTTKHSYGLDACPDGKGDGVAGNVFRNFAPVIEGNWVFVGEVDKWVPASYRRLLSLNSSYNFLNVTLAGAPAEEVHMVVFPPTETEKVLGSPTQNPRPTVTTCSFPACSVGTDGDCIAHLICTPNSGCKC